MSDNEDGRVLMGLRLLKQTQARLEAIKRETGAPMNFIVEQALSAYFARYDAKTDAERPAMQEAA